MQESLDDNSFKPQGLSSSQRLLLVVSDLGFFWSHRLPLAVGARDAGWEVHVAGPSAKEATRLNEFGFIAHDLPDFRVHGAALGGLHTLRATAQVVRQIEPTLVNAISLKTSFFCGLALPKNVPAVFTITGLGYLYRGEGIRARALRTLAQPFLKWAIGGPRHQIIFQNSDDLHLLASLGVAAAEKSHLVRGSGVDLNHFRPAQNDKEPPHAVLTARLVREKGILVFVEAAKRLAAKGITARYTIAGGDAPFNPNAISANELRNSIAGTPVEWTGHIDDVCSLYRSASFAVLPSYYGEGLPKALLEAAACGLPIITTDHPGCREAVVDGVNGLLVPPRNAIELASAMERLLTDKELRSRMGQASREKAEQEFGTEKVVSETLAVYNKALQVR